MEDNEGATRFANDPISSQRTRYIDVRERFLRHVSEKVIKIIHVGTVDRYADFMTKALDKTRSKRDTMNMAI